MKTLQKTLSGLLILTLFVPNLALFAQSVEQTGESTQATPPPTENTPPSQIIGDSGTSVGENPPQIDGTPTTVEVISDEIQKGDVSNISPEEKTTQATNLQYTLPGGTRTPEITYQQKINAAVDTFSGALTQSIPIQIPSGRNGLQPSLSLDYNNQNQDTFSQVGFGWNLSVPTIERVNKTGIEKLYTDNYFTSSLSGELASTTDAALFKTKNENGDFLKYSFVANVWTVVDKKGITYKFGATESSRQFSVSSTASTTKWMLSEVQDSNNNFYRYEYVKDGNEIYPSKVLYTGNGTQVGIYAVEFVLENRPDTYVSYKNGYKVETKKRIKEILIKVSDTERGKYMLGYTAGANNTRSLLGSVIESRISESGVLTTMPATTFQYTNDSVTYVARDSNANAATRDGYFQSGRIAIDFDGNGLNEKVASYSMDYNNGVTTGSMYSQSLNLGEAQTQAFNKIVPSPWTTGPNGFPEEFFDYGTRVFDFNGDLLPDLVRAREPRLEESSISGLFLNIGDLNFSTTTGNAQIPTFRYFYYTGASTAYVNSALLANVNGDQLVDTYSQSTQCQLTAIPGPAQHYCGLPGAYIGTGSGWTMDPRNLFSNQLVHGAEIPDTIIFADVNNDGLDDQIKQQGASTTVAYLNLGNNMWSATSSTWSIPHPLQEIGAWPKYDQGVRVFDVNGDGLVDVIRSYYVNIPSNTSNMSVNATGRYMPFPSQGNYKVVYLNTGSGWIPNTDISVFGVVDNVEITNYNWRGNFLINDSYFDANGDGLTDFGNNIRQGRKPDMLIKTTYGTGAVVDVEYKPTAQQSNKHPKLPSVIYTVTKLTKSAAGQHSQVTEYAYEGGKNDFRGPNTLKFAGFKKVTESRDDTKTTSYFHQGDDSDASLGEQNDEYAKIGKVFREDITNANGNLYKRNWYKWDAVSRGNGAGYTYLTDSVEQVYDGNTSHKDKAVTNVYDTTNGNLLTSTDWGEVQASNTGIFTDIGNDKQVTTIAYATNTTQNQFAPKEITKVNASGALIEKAKLYYDNAAHGTLTKGNATKTEQYKDGASFVTTTKSYNSFGLVATEQDANGNATEYKYDGYNLYPVVAANALNQKTEYTYDYALGTPLSVTTPDEASYLYIYDGFGRPLEEWVPEKGASSMRKTSFEYTDISNNMSVKKYDYVDENNAIETYTYFDGLNRPVQTKREGEFGNWVTTDTVYDARGRTLKQSLPYFTQTESKSLVTTNNNLFTSFTYDVQDRVLTQTNSVSVTRYEYDDWKKTVTDALSHSKYFYNDAFGNLVKVTESTGLIDYNTLYEYNGQNKLTKITDANNNIRNFTYDLLGRQLNAEDIHAPSDANFASYTYVYDNSGNVTQKTTPDDVVVIYTYDALNRILNEEAPGKKQERMEYTYDTCEYGFGKVCEVKKIAVQPFIACDILGCASTVTPVTTKTFNYTGPGLVAREVSTIAGATYTTEYGYDRQGNKLSITNPDTSITTYTYNQAGLLEDVQYHKDGQVKTIVSNFDYAPIGLPILQVNGNGTQTCNTYDGNKLYRLTNKKMVGVGGVCVGGTQVAQNEMTFTQAVQVVQNNQESIDQKIARLLQEGKAVVNEKGETRLITPEVLQENEYEKESLIGFTQDRESLYQYEVVIGKDIPGTEITTLPATPDLESVLQLVATSSVSVAPQGTVLATNYYAGNIVPYPNPWDVVRNTTTGFHLYNAGNAYATSEFGRNRTQAIIHRTFMNFDTRNIPDNAILQSAYLDLYALPYSNTSSPTDYMGVLQNLQTSSSSLSLSDYSKCGSPQSLPVLGGKKLLSEFNAQRYYRFSLFAEAKPWINVQGNTSLCVREGHDIENEAPPENTYDMARRGIIIYPEDAHPTQRSKIVVEYTLPVVITTTSNLATTSVTNLSQPLSSANIHTHGYVYDAVGNITSVVNTTATSSAQTTIYTYDNLDRLLSATNGSVTEDFTYDGIGNILTKNGVPYLYETPSKTNPHAVTKVGAITLTYDENGNVLTIGEQTNPTTNIYNYKNELTQTTRGGAVANYLYDENGIRLYKKIGAIETSYPNPFFSQTSTGTTTTLIMAGNDNIATIESGIPLWNHTDHLGSTVATTNLQGNTVEQTKYSAYGHQISRSTFQNTSQTEKYTGHTYDPETDLLYAQARYYRGSLGRFLSQDPVFWEVGQSEDGKKILTSPQFQNGYSYGVNNPIRKKDPTGKIPVDIVADAGFILYDLASLGYNTFKGNIDAAATDRQALGLDVAGAAIPYATGFGAVMRAGKTASVVSDIKNTAKLSDDMLVCRGGGCKAENFLKGSNEYKNGLNPGPNSPLTGISVNVGKNINDLAGSGSVQNYSKYGQSTLKSIQDLGGKVKMDTLVNPKNPFHGNIQGLNSRQLEKLFSPVNSNSFKKK